MKFNHHYHFYSRVFISLLIFSFGFFLWQKSVDTRALVDNVYTHNTPIVGWAYNDSMGWIAMSCANDFVGDGVVRGDYSAGTGTCSTRWGLKMASSTGDYDSNPLTPNTALHHVQGCAWAGNIGAVGGYESTTPGWICFSNDANGGNGSTAAPTNGVLMSKLSEAYIITTCECEAITGVCPAGSPINRNEPCLAYSICTGSSNVCNLGSGLCSLSNSSCSDDFDCQFACESTNSAFVARGVCYDYTDTEVNNDPRKQVLLNNRGNLPPFSGITDPYMHPCYINKDCYDQSDIRNIGHPNGECLYPQYGISIGGGTGKCMDDSTTPAIAQADGATCVYDFDCILGNYCALSLDAKLPNAPTSCGLSCTGGYKEVSTVSSGRSFPLLNTLSSDPLLTEGFASIVKLESVTTTPGYAEANKIGFPIGNKTKTYSTLISIDTDHPDYDVDDPNNNWPNTSINNNPLRGCFNCYREKTYKCVSNSVSCSCDQSLDSCNVPTCAVNAGDSVLCSVSSLAPAVCENCQEYFYYSDHKKFCSINTNFDCTATGLCPDPFESCILHNKFCSIRTDFDCTTASCPTGFGSCGVRQPGELKKVLTGFDCSDCIVDNEQNSCSLNSLNINSNRCQKCLSFSGGAITDPNNYSFNVYRLGGVLYDNQHGRSSTSTLCGWGYNAWENNQCSISKIPCTLQTDCSLGGEICRSNTYGFGWINFSPRISTSANPYFSVEKGNIYSKGNISSRYQPPINKYNASYLIEAGGTITNFVSEASKQPESALSYQGEMPNRPIINFLNPISGLGSNYKNALGKLDFNGLVTTARTTSGVNYNKYGSEIITYVNNTVDPNNDYVFTSLLTQNNPVNNKVLIMNGVIEATYTYVGSATDLIIKAGRANESGAGIIVVNGNLFIVGNIKYDTTSVTNIKQIPSLVWIVKGDLIIDESVTEVAGTFIVLGDGQLNDPYNTSSRTDCRDLVQWAPTAVPPGGWYSYEGCGQFQSLWINTVTGQPFHAQIIHPLKIIGNVVARKFELVRTYTDPLGTPAEQFINDGRLQANPPLGLKDMSKVIPRFSSY